MASEIGYVNTDNSGATLYMVVSDMQQRPWNTSGTPAFESYNPSNWTSYDVALTEQGSSGRFVGTFPPGITTPGNYGIDIRVQASGSPAVSDESIDAGSVAWTGSTIVPMTGDAFAVVSHVSHGNSALKTLIDTITNRIGAFTGTGVNTILGFLRALLRSDASNPSDVGGTFDPGNHSTQAIRARGDAAWVTSSAPIIAQAIRESQLSGEVADPGEVPTLEQALMLLHQERTQKSVVDQTLTIYEPNGSTPLATLGLNSPASPTALTRES